MLKSISNAKIIIFEIPVFGTPALLENRGWFLVHAGYWFVRMAVAQGILSFWR